MLRALLTSTAVFTLMFVTAYGLTAFAQGKPDGGMDLMRHDAPDGGAALPRHLNPMLHPFPLDAGS